MEEPPKLINQSDGTAIVINNTAFTLGRNLSCDYVLQSIGISRFHCMIKKNGNKWTLFDRSMNGTVVNSKTYKFNESTELKDGDFIQIGSENFKFHIGTEVPEIEPEVLAELEKPFEAETVPPKPEESTSQTTVTTAPKLGDPKEEIMENELSCSICSELFVKAVTLNCAHTFCSYCINQWKKNKSTCPICRKTIQTMSATLVLDNVIEKFMSTQSVEVQESRKSLVQMRADLGVQGAGSSKQDVSTIEIESDDDDDPEYSDHYDYGDDYLDEEEEEDEDDLLFEFDGPRTIRGGYYGGYGRCFICNQPGHWANSCPFK